MSRAATAPNYLGGIGLMLEVAHVCPRCGKRLPDSPTASNRHLSGRGCRPTVFAALPEFEPPSFEDEEVPPVPAGRRIHDFEVPTAQAAAARQDESVPPVSAAPSEPALSRALAVPWLRPPDLGEVL